MDKPYDLAVAWRIYPGVSKEPLIFPNDKYELVKTCLKSFILSTQGLKIKYFFILDGCPPKYKNLIEQLFDLNDTSIIEMAGVGNLATFKKQIDILSNQKDAEVVYFAEDDYLYREGEFKKMLQLLKQEDDVDFVSCYLHMDTFTHPIHRHDKDKKIAFGHTWISDSSTCLTFMTSRQTLLETKNILLTYSKGNNDCAMWLVLTKTFIYNPLSYLRFMFTHKESFSILKMAVKYSFRYFFTRKKYKLWIPDPAIGTHLEKDLVSPGVDWINISQEVQMKD